MRTVRPTWVWLEKQDSYVVDTHNTSTSPLINRLLVSELGKHGLRGGLAFNVADYYLLMNS